MRNMLGNKAQFFILTTVVVVGVFYSLSRYINPYSFIDTSSSARQEDYFLFDNIQAKAIKTISVSDVNDLNNNLADYKNFAENLAAEKGYIVNFDYTLVENAVQVNMFLISEKHTLKTDFTVPKNGVVPVSTTTTTVSTTSTTSSTTSSSTTSSTSTTMSTTTTSTSTTTTSTTSSTTSTTLPITEHCCCDNYQCNTGCVLISEPCNYFSPPKVECDDSYCVESG